MVHRFSVNASTTDYEVRYYTDGYYGRPKGLRYPGGVGVAYHYNTASYPVQEKDASSSYVIRQVSARDSRNEVIAATLANGALTQSAAFYPATGQMQSIAVTGPGGSLHDLYYEYDGYGNLNYQTTTIGAAVSTEGFFYDALHRLTQSSRSYPTGSKTVNYAYDPSGNLTLKDDYATSYTYSTTTRPNAVTSITKVGGGSVTFSYDANGNLTSGDGKSLTYTAFNKPRTITAGGITATFHYGADLARYRQEKTNGETTLYIDKLMEIVSVGASTDYRHYLGENAILTKIDSLSDPYPALTLVLRDRLGSVVTLTDETGTNPERRGYDPFGKPRDGDWAEKTPPTIGSAITDRGFTDHEHLDESKLIHMNGRAYDYQLGRFLSVDPFIQEPGNSQSLNPYSYIMNNPLSGVDPSGYKSVTLTGSRFKVDEDKIKAAGNQILGGVGQPLSFNGTIAVSNGASTGRQSNASGSSGGASTDDVSELGSQGGRREFGSGDSGVGASDTNGPTNVPTDDGISARVGKEIGDLIAPTNGMVVGRGPNGRRLSELPIREMAGEALAKLRQARRTGTGRGGTIGAAVFLDEDGLTVSVPNVAGADGLVSQGDGAIGRTSAASAGAIAIFILLPNRVDSTPVGRGAPQFVQQAMNASLVDAAGLPVVVVGPRGAPRTGLMFEAIIGGNSNVIGVVDEVSIR